MTHFENRLRKLESALGMAADDFRSKTFSRIIVLPGKTVADVREREGVPDDMPCIARIIVEPSAPDRVARKEGDQE